MWTNYEVLGFQPRSGIAPFLDYVTIITTYSSPNHPTCISHFLDRFISLLPSTSPPPVASGVISPISLCNARYPLPLPLWYVFHLDFYHPRHPLASAACACSPCRVSASAAVSFILSLPIFLPWTVPRSLSAPRGAHVASPSVSLVSPPLPPFVILRLLSYSYAL